MATHDLVWAAVVTGVFGTIAVVLTNRHQRNMKALSLKIDLANQRLDTGNGVTVGSAVRDVKAATEALKQTADVVVSNQHLQMTTLSEHGRKLIELTESQTDHGAKLEDLAETQSRQGDLLNDHLFQLDEAAEQLAAKGRLHVRKTDTEGTGS